MSAHQPKPGRRSGSRPSRVGKSLHLRISSSWIMGTDNLLSSSMVKRLLLQGIQWERVNGLLDVNSKVLLNTNFLLDLERRREGWRVSSRTKLTPPQIGRSPECVHTPSSSFLLQPWLDNDITWWRLFFKKNPGQIYKNDAQAA